MDNRGRLVRQLGLRTGIALVVGEVIAVGIFLTPAGMAKSLASPLLALVVWLAMGAMAICGAFCYAELASRFPEAGGGYVYLREAYGPKVAFLYGWMSLLVMDPGLTAALAVGAATYAGYVAKLSPLAMKLLAMAVVLFMAAINIVGVRFGAGLIRWLTILKLGLLLLIILWGFGFQLGDWSNFAPFVARRESTVPLLPALAGAFVAAFFSFGGWWDVNKLAGEMRNPQRDLPRALFIGVLLVTVVYLLTSAVFVYLVPLERVTSGETFAAQAGEALFGRSGGIVFASIVIVSVVGSLAGIVLAAPRVTFALASDGLFLPMAAKLHPRFGTPARAIALQAVLACVLIAFGSFDQIIAYFIFVVVLFIALTVAGLFVLRHRMPDAEIQYKATGYPATPIIFIALIGLLLVMLLGKSPLQSLLGLAVVAAGVPIYHLAFRE